MKVWNKLAKAIPIALLAFGLLGFGPKASAQNLIEKIEKKGTLTVGISTFVPWAMRDKDGKLIGFEVDVATQLAKDMGVKVEFVPTDWGGIIPALLAGKFDVIIAGMSITPQRNLTVNFTIPYAQSGQQIVANVQLAGKFTKLSDFNASNVTMACRRATLSCPMAEKMFPKATLRQFDNEAQAYQEVINGNAYGMIASAPTPRFWSNDYPNKLVVPAFADNLSASDEAFALRKGDVDALNYFDNWIIYHTHDGWLKERHDFWFNSKAGWQNMMSAK